MLGSIGMPELILILVIALIVFGPKKLPEIGRSLGKGLAEFKKASDDLKQSIQKEVEGLEQKAKLETPAPAEPPVSPANDKTV
jgi:sec-independent protein translocase protein TatA